MYAILSPLSEPIVLFFVFGSGFINAYSPASESEEGALVEIILSSPFVIKGISISVLKSMPIIVLFNGSSPILTLSLKVCWFKFKYEKPSFVFLS